MAPKSKAKAKPHIGVKRKRGDIDSKQTTLPFAPLQAPDPPPPLVQRYDARWRQELEGLHLFPVVLIPIVFEYSFRDLRWRDPWDDILETAAASCGAMYDDGRHTRWTSSSNTMVYGNIAFATRSADQFMLLSRVQIATPQAHAQVKITQSHIEDGETKDRCLESFHPLKDKEQYVVETIPITKIFKYAESCWYKITPPHASSPFLLLNQFSGTQMMTRVYDPLTSEEIGMTTFVFPVDYYVNDYPYELSPGNYILFLYDSKSNIRLYQLLVRGASTATQSASQSKPATISIQEALPMCKARDQPKLQLFKRPWKNAFDRRMMVTWNGGLFAYHRGQHVGRLDYIRLHDGPCYEITEYRLDNPLPVGVEREEWGDGRLFLSFTNTCLHAGRMGYAGIDVVCYSLPPEGFPASGRRACGRSCSCVIASP